nr:MAG TPA: receptor binding protein [Caudoviricetes sp.]
MTTTLITGKGGTPHITSGDMGAMQAGIIGNGSYLLQGSDGTFPTVTMQDANHALIPVLNLVVEGRYARVTEAETATIESGVSGRNRNDLVCLKYTRNGQNIETAAIAVLKGTPNTGTAADPTVPSGSIHSASGTVWIPIARIPISGITPGTPVMLIKQLPPMSKLWDSVTLYQDSNWIIMRNGRIILIKFSGKIGSGSWDAVECPVKLASWYRPIVDLSTVCLVSNGQTARSLTARADGTIRVANMGNVGSNQDCVGTLCFPIP